MEEFDPTSIGAVAVADYVDSGTDRTGNAVSSDFDPASIGAVPVDEQFDPRSLGAVPVEQDSGFVASFKGVMSSNLAKTIAAIQDVASKPFLDVNKSLAAGGDTVASEQIQKNLSLMGEAALNREASKLTFEGASPESTNVAAQLGRGAASVASMVPAMTTGAAAFPLMALQGAGEAYESTLASGGTEQEAQKAMVKTAPHLLLYLAGGRLASGLATKLLGKEASTLARGLTGAGLATVSNVATSSVIRTLEAPKGQKFSAAIPTIETLTADTLFGVYHGVGEYRNASLEAKRRAYTELQDRGFSKEEIKETVAEPKAEAIIEKTPEQMVVESAAPPAGAPAAEVPKVTEPAPVKPSVEQASPAGPRIVSTGIMTPEGIATYGEWNTKHADIIKNSETIKLALAEGMDPEALDANKGFIVEENGKQRFVGRKEALEIARKSGQVDESVLYSPEKQGLISEALIEPKGGETSAETVRSDQEQVHERGNAQEPSPDARREDLQQQASRPSDEAAQEGKVEQAANELQQYRTQAIEAARQAGATDPELAASVAQQQSAEKGNTDPALFIQTARRRGLDQLKATKPTVSEEEAPEATVERGPRAETISQEDISAIDQAVNKLPEVQRNIIRELEKDPNLTDQQVGSILNLTIDQVKKAKAAFRKTLQSFIEEEGIGVSMGPGAASANEILVRYELRKFSKRFDEDQSMAEEVRRATGGRYYEPIPNKVTAEQAVKLIEERGEEVIRDQIKDESSGLSYADRVTVGEILIKRWNERYKSLKESNPEEAYKALDEASGLGEWAAEYGTRLGQGVQSFAMWNRLTPAGKLRSFKRVVQKVRTRHKSDNRTEVEEIKDKLNSATKEGAETASKSTKVRSKLATSKRQQKPTKDREKPRPKSLDRDVWVQYQQQAIKNLESALFSGNPTEQPALQEFTNRLVSALKGKIPAKITEPKTAQEKKAEDIRVIREAMTNREKYEEVWTNTTNALKLRYGDKPEILKKIDEVFAGGLKNPLNPKTLQSLIRERIKSDEIKLSELVRKHYSKAEETGKTLADKISEEIGLDEAGSREVASAIESQFAGEVTKAKSRAMASLVKTNSVAKKIGKDQAQKLIEVSNLGALTDQTFYEAVTERLGLPKFDDSISKEIMRLATIADQAPDGIPKQEAIRDLNTYIAQQKGFDWTDLPFGMYYGNILSGLNTQAVNLVDTALNVKSEILTLMMTDPRAASAIMSGALRGASEGRWDAMLALTEGRRISDGKLVEDPFFMEISKFGKKGGVPISQGTRMGRATKFLAETPVAKFLNAYKFVGRAMSASDTLAFRTAQEAKSAQLAWRLANEEGATGDALRTRMDEILGYDRLEDFRKQASLEGFTGKKAEARAFELMELSRPEELQKASRDFASESTYNYKPYGVMGSISNRIEEFSRDYKVFKLVVPFTRIVANVTNRGLNNTPYGYVRAYRGKAGRGRAEKVFSPEERQALNVRATMGTVALSALLILHESGVIQISGQGPSDAEKKRQLKETGWKPYSIKVGDTHYSYAYTPVGLGLAIMGNILDSIKYNDFSQKDALGVGAYALSSVGSTLFNQSFLSSLSKLFDILAGKSPAQQIAGLKSWASSTAASLAVPFASFTKDMESLFSDPNLPKTDTFAQALVSSIPFASQGLKPQLNAFGQPIKSSRNRFWRGETNDPVWKMVADKQLRVPVASNFFDDPDQNYEYTKRSGQRLRTWMETAIPMLRNMERKSAQDAIERQADYIRSIVRSELMSGGARKKVRQP